jgi:hypothetical protein
MWRAILNTARADDKAYEQELAKLLRQLVCTPETNAIHILRGIIFEGVIPINPSRLTAAGREARELIDDILEGQGCPVSSALTDADRARLQEIRRML